ncbi:patr class I histocompatibility antigen, B-2 alpha chain-like [Varanus komodoensis]|uniref:Ig-like domain-containing protein n=1 Tax=Varanus komodoensis TaxID=61221 RepID=A0A8D2J2D9_VARKO|nr:patr class I histocompatibility antigen, B-2 alpha chain-like [Varanus komodoensis]XP_044304093.1 patr class I histocompatibility antigen, B-2 alpha chain-like [Varanus komodoensis]
MYGCELRSDGSKGGYDQYGYDGKDYISLDKETLTWTAADAKAQITKRKWEKDLAFAQGMKAYLEKICIEWLQRYLEYGKETLQQRRAQPTLRVTRGAAPDGRETLLCRADGFYPKEMEIAWTRDGEVWTQDTFRGLVTPNADGTYHTWISAKIDPQERDRYRCSVGHDSLPDLVEVAWEEPEASVPPLGLVVGLVVGGLVLLAALIGGIFLYRKRQAGYKAASTSDRSSDSSARGSNPAI